MIDIADIALNVVKFVLILLFFIVALILGEPDKISREDQADKSGDKVGGYKQSKEVEQVLNELISRVEKDEELHKANEKMYKVKEKMQKTKYGEDNNLQPYEYLGQDAMLIFDGHNLIHNYMDKFGVSFQEAAKEVKKRIKHFKGHCVAKVDLHSVFENFDYAEGEAPKGKQHYLQGRDDFLAWLIAKRYKNPYIVSNDNFVDYKDFSKIPKFTHKVYEKKKLKETKSIDPFMDYSLALEPSKTNRLKFEFGDKKGIKLGGHLKIII